jgi:hypothetical protein
MQGSKDSQAFTIVERYFHESVSVLLVMCGISRTIAEDCLQSQKYHLENPYWKPFDPYVLPLLEKPMDLRRYEERDTSKDVAVE